MKFLKGPFPQIKIGTQASSRAEWARLTPEQIEESLNAPTTVPNSPIEAGPIYKASQFSKQQASKQA